MIGGLMYVTASLPYIMQEVGLVGRFQETPKETYVLVVKRLFRYIKGMLEFGLWYPIGKDFTLIAYPDAYWVGSVDDRKGTSGGSLFLGNILVSWFRKKKS
jgi:hypothetical protein